MNPEEKARNKSTRRWALAAGRFKTIESLTCPPRVVLLCAKFRSKMALRLSAAG
jgi:hypothetical protein